MESTKIRNRTQRATPNIPPRVAMRGKEIRFLKSVTRSNHGTTRHKPNHIQKVASFRFSSVLERVGKFADDDSEASKASREALSAKRRFSRRSCFVIACCLSNQARCNFSHVDFGDAKPIAPTIS